MLEKCLAPKEMQVVSSGHTKFVKESWKAEQILSLFPACILKYCCQTYGGVEEEDVCAIHNQLWTLSPYGRALCRLDGVFGTPETCIS